MKTQLPESISSITEAIEFLTALHGNGEAYHPDDNAHEIEWQTTEVTPAECDKLNKLMEDIYNLPGNDNYLDMAFCPCGFLLAFEGKIDFLSEQTWVNVLEALPRETLIQILIAHDKDGTYTDADQIAQHGSLSTKEDLTRAFWYLYTEGEQTED